MYPSNEGSDKTEPIPRLDWAFADQLCDKYQDLRSESYGPRRDKPVIGVSVKARLKQVSLASETS